MRTDVTIDKKQVHCPNTSRLGFDKSKAQVGDLILFSEGERIITARMIGRIAYAPQCAETPPIRGWILAICLNDSLDHTFERWVNPADVLRVEPLENESIHRRAVTEYFLSDELTQAPINEVRRSTTDGWSTLAKYRAEVAKRAADLADFERRHPSGCACKICIISGRTV